MDSSLANKIYKARIYAEEPERIRIRHVEAVIEGDDRTHSVVFAEDGWSCDCEFFGSHRLCAHTMAMERVMKPLVPVPAVR